jgi:Flp pilus assembly protein TadG
VLQHVSHTRCRINSASFDSASPASTDPASTALTGETGATAVFVALMLTLMLAMVGLAIDGSNAYFQQQRMQIAADAGALAGARLLALGASAADVNIEAQSLAALNGATTAAIAVLEADRAVEVRATQTFDTFFIRIVGPARMTVSAAARAGYINVGRAGNLMPLTTMCPPDGFIYGQVYELMDGDLDAPGNFGWLSWTGSNSAPTLAQNIESPANSPVLEVGDWVQTTTGATYGSFVATALDGWIGIPVTIPLYDQITGTGNGARYRVCGFAQFVLVSHSNKMVSGRFVRNLIPGEELTGVVDLGSRDVRMLQ